MQQRTVEEQLRQVCRAWVELWKTGWRGQASEKLRLGWQLLGFFALTLGVACSSQGDAGTRQVRSPRAAESLTAPDPMPLTNGRPTIFYIGEKAILTFEAGKDLHIPIKGADLYLGQQAWSISVDGVVPAVRGTDFQLKTFADYRTDFAVGLGNAVLILSSNYTARLKDGDQFTVSADILDVNQDLLHQTMNDIQQFNLLVEELHSTITTNAPTITTNANANQNTSTWKRIRQLKAVLSRVPQLSNHLRGLTNDTQVPQRETAGQLTNSIIPAALQKELIEEARPIVRFPAVASATRRFVLFSPGGYRNRYLATRLPANDLKVLPQIGRAHV